jgi:antitoxin (DNA-binding transcriptional repressor) of toxin-antitoxin stability system
MNINTIKTIPITDLRRNFSKVEKLLTTEEIIRVTKKGKWIATLSPSVEYKRNLLKKTAGALKGTDLDDDKLWAEVGKKYSRKKKISLS